MATTRDSRFCRPRTEFRHSSRAAANSRKRSWRFRQTGLPRLSGLTGFPGARRECGAKNLESGRVNEARARSSSRTYHVDRADDGDAWRGGKGLRVSRESQEETERPGGDRGARESRARSRFCAGCRARSGMIVSFSLAALLIESKKYFITLLFHRVSLRLINARITNVNLAYVHFMYGHLKLD